MYMKLLFIVIFASTIVDIFYDTIILLTNLFTITYSREGLRWAESGMIMPTQGDVLWTYNLSDGFGLQHKDSDHLCKYCASSLYFGLDDFCILRPNSQYFSADAPPMRRCNLRFVCIKPCITGNLEEAGSRKHKIQQLVFVLLLPFFFYGGRCSGRGVGQDSRSLGTHAGY
jgi:hypothetical protein